MLPNAEQEQGNPQPLQDLLIEHLNNAPNAIARHPERQRADKNPRNKITPSHAMPPARTTGDCSPAAIVAVGRR